MRRLTCRWNAFRKAPYFSKYFRSQMEPCSGKQITKWQIQWWVIYICLRSRMENKWERIYGRNEYIYKYIYIYILFYASTLLLNDRSVNFWISSACVYIINLKSPGCVSICEWNVCWYLLAFITCYSITYRSSLIFAEEKFSFKCVNTLRKIQKFSKPEHRNC